MHETETGRFQRLHRLFNAFVRDDDIDVGRGQRLLGPVVHGQPADHAPGNFKSLENLN